MYAPEVIELQKVRLRLPKLSDAEAILEYASDPAVVHYMDWPRSTAVGPIREVLKEKISLWESGTEFNWIITLLGQDRAIGGIACEVARHAVGFGYLLNKNFWGKGIATELSKTIASWALSDPSIWRVWATCDAENFASARVLEKAGFLREGTLRRSIIRPNISDEPRDAFLYSRVRQAV